MSRRNRIIDAHIGGRIRERRIMLGLTRQKLAATIGITYQQMHKYEHGFSRMSAGQLYLIARELHAPIADFYEGADSREARPVPSRRRMLLEITRNFGEMQNQERREAFSQLARALASR